MGIKAVIFDFAGVIGVDGYWAWLRDNITDLPKQEEFFHKISYQVDRAELSEAEFLDQISAKCDLPPERIRREIMARLIIDPEMPVLLKSLKSRYKVGLLSNFVFSWLDQILKQNDLYPLFDHAVISSAISMAKPDAPIFHHALKLLAVEPEEAVFIDDRMPNVIAAERLGMTGLLFKSAAKLKTDLLEIGVET